MTLFLAGIMVGSLVLYCLLGGADYGAGLWDLLSSGPRKTEQQDLIQMAIQPIWEANHVWLILLLVLLFSGFPSAFATLMIALHVPILLVLLGVVLRGAAFVFRAYSTGNPRMQRAWAYVFSVASCFTPFFLGITLGSLSNDQVMVEHDVSMNGYLAPWFNPFSISVGLLSLSLFAFLAACYLAVEARAADLLDDFRRRALASGAVATLLAIVTFVLSARYAPGIRDGLFHHPLAWIVETSAVIAAAATFIALLKGRVHSARITAALQVSLIVVGWAGAQNPYLVRPQMTIWNSVASDLVIRDLVIASLAGATILFPSLWVLYRVFKRNLNVTSSTITHRETSA